MVLPSLGEARPYRDVRSEENNSASTLLVRRCMKTTFVLTTLPEPSSYQTADCVGKAEVETMAPVAIESSPRQVSYLTVIFGQLLASK